jgi:hypothetical protein
VTQFANELAKQNINYSVAILPDMPTYVLRGRVGKDSMRKLFQLLEHVLGTIYLSQKHVFDISGLEFGVACVIMYSVLMINEMLKKL